MNIPDRILQRIEITETCWLWRGNISRDGYGKFDSTSAHRVVYETLVGPIPEGMHLDHLCRVTQCVNPEHMEPVTPAENIRRRFADHTHCRRGHEYTPENTYINKGKRYCRACGRIRTAAYNARKRAAVTS